MQGVLISLFERNYIVINTLLKDVSDQESRKKPQPEGNNINWVVGHIVVVRNNMMTWLDANEFWSERESALYKWNSKPLDSQEGFPLHDLLSALDTSQERLIGALKHMTDEQLQCISLDDQSLCDRLLSMAWHESYHTGQLGLIRRIIGKGSAY